MEYKHVGSIAQATQQIHLLEDKLRHLERETQRKEADFHQQKALLLQKIKFLQGSNQEYKSKQRNLQTKLKQLRNEASVSLKTTQLNYQSQIEKLKRRLEAIIKQSSEYEQKLAQKQTQVQELNNKVEQIKSSLTEQNQQIKNLNEKLKKDIRELERNHEDSIIMIENTQVTATARLRARLEQTQKKLRSSEELLRNDMTLWAKDNAILVQKIQFLEQEIEDMNQKRDEEKKQYQSMIKALEAQGHQNKQQSVNTRIQISIKKAY